MPFFFFRFHRAIQARTCFKNEATVCQCWRRQRIGALPTHVSRIRSVMTYAKLSRRTHHKRVVYKVIFFQFRNAEGSVLVHYIARTLHAQCIEVYVNDLSVLNWANVNSTSQQCIKSFFLSISRHKRERSVLVYYIGWTFQNEAMVCWCGEESVFVRYIGSTFHVQYVKAYVNKPSAWNWANVNSASQQTAVRPLFICLDCASLSRPKDMFQRAGGILSSDEASVSVHDTGRCTVRFSHRVRVQTVLW